MEYNGQWKIACYCRIVGDPKQDYRSFSWNCLEFLNLCFGADISDLLHVNIVYEANIDRIGKKPNQTVYYTRGTLFL